MKEVLTPATVTYMIQEDIILSEIRQSQTQQPSTQAVPVGGKFRDRRKNRGYQQLQEGKWGNGLMGREFQFCKMRRALEIDVEGNVAT